MAIFYNNTQGLQERVADALANDFKHSAIEKAQDTFHAKREKLVADMPEWENFRHAANAIRSHVTRNLDYYVRQFAENASAAGNIVHFATTESDAIDEILSIVEQKGSKICVKTKSMLSEEIGTNEALAEVGVTITETDCAEHIIQTAGDAPSHIVVPALHFDREEIAQLYRNKRGYEGSSVPEDITRFLRKILREEFLKADVGMTGCNFAVAETGSVTLVTNEGNGRMVDSMPELQIILVGIDRIVPDLASLDVMMALLVRSAVGSKISSYFTIDSGPRNNGEVDGPAETHIVIIDNNRSRILESEASSMLRCIRCGACLNTCPVYRHITGHGYGSIYPGPMGIVLTTELTSYEESKELPFACTLCSACDDVCPVEIPLHSLILQQRQRVIDEGYGKALEGLVFGASTAFLNSNAIYGAGTKVGGAMMRSMAHGKGSLDEKSAWLPVLGGWTKTRDVDVLQPELFRTWFKKHKASKKEQGE